VPPGMRAQLTQFIRVARANMLSLRLAQVPGGHAKVWMDFAEHPCFAVVKFR
jgi:hypothetical protein